VPEPYCLYPAEVRPRGPLGKLSNYGIAFDSNSTRPEGDM